MRGRRRGSDSNSHWLSFSDLMTSLVLVIILVLFYFLYQYFLMYDDYEQKRDQMVLLQATLEQTEQDIALKDQELTQKDEELTAAQADLETAQGELTAAQEDLAVQQLLLSAAQEAQELTQQELDQQQQELDQALSQLEENQQQIASQQEQLDNQQQQIEQLVGVRTRIIASLSQALEEANISASVDPTTGAIALASDVLFQTGESELSALGKTRIDQFLPVYLSVLFSEEYRPYVSEIIIEGHTDSVGNYISNLRLSQERAFSVASYVLDDSYSAISTETRELLRRIATANGRSFSDLILDENGQEDRDASRRVVFKFRLTDEQMVSQLQAILEGES